MRPSWGNSTEDAKLQPSEHDSGHKENHHEIEMHGRLLALLWLGHRRQLLAVEARRQPVLNRPLHGANMGRGIR
jgi:hypothetical protein